MKCIVDTRILSIDNVDVHIFEWSRCVDDDWDGSDGLGYRGVDELS